MLCYFNPLAPQGIQSLNENRSPGVDDCAPKNIKRSGPKLPQWLFNLMTRIWLFATTLPSMDSLERWFRSRRRHLQHQWIRRAPYACSLQSISSMLSWCSRRCATDQGVCIVDAGRLHQGSFMRQQSVVDTSCRRACHWVQRSCILCLGWLQGCVRCTESHYSRPHAQPVPLAEHGPSSTLPVLRR